MLDPIGPQGLSRLGPQPWPGREPGSPAHTESWAAAGPHAHPTTYLLPPSPDQMDGKSSASLQTIIPVAHYNPQQAQQPSVPGSTSITLSDSAQNRTLGGGGGHRLRPQIQSGQRAREKASLHTSCALMDQLFSSFCIGLYRSANCICKNILFILTYEYEFLKMLSSPLYR